MYISTCIYIINLCMCVDVYEIERDDRYKSIIYIIV